MDYKIPFKTHMTDKKKLFLKTLQQMLAKNEMIKRPPKVYSPKKYIKIDGRKRLIHVGKKGGRYYIKNKKKHYIPKGKKLVGGNQVGGNFDFSGALTAAGLFMLSKMLKEKKFIKKKSKKITLR